MIPAIEVTIAMLIVAKAPVIDCRTSRTITYPTVMVVAIVSTLPTVTHSEMMGVVVVDIVVTTTVIPSSSTYYMPCMTSTITGVEYRATIVEIVTMRIAGIDAEVPETVSPVERTIEIGGCTEGA